MAWQIPDTNLQLCRGRRRHSQRQQATELPGPPRSKMVLCEVPFSKQRTELVVFKNNCYGAGEMAQWLVLAALLEDLGSIPSTHVAAHNSLEL